MSEALDLSAVFDRDTVKLPGGATYEIKNPEEFGILEEHKLNALIQRIDAARSKAATEAATEEDAQLASDLLNELATLLLIDLPDDVRVGDWESVAIFDFHMKKRIARMQQIAKDAGVDLPPLTGGAKKRPRTGAKSPRASKRSTAATRKRGS